MISGEGIRQRLEAQGLVIDLHYINKLINEIHPERTKRASTLMLNQALARVLDEDTADMSAIAMLGLAG